MVGNDIIDLKLAAQESNWERPRFLNKLFTKNEQQFIRSSSNPFETLWLLWSMKESAYKIYMQQGGSRIFAPLKFECVVNDFIQGFVTFRTSVYKTKSAINSNFIHTVASSKKNDSTIHIYHLKDISANAQSIEIYRLLISSIAKQRNLNFEYLEIKKTVAGIPQLYSKDSLLDIFISLSHHGRYGAVVFL